MTTRWITDDDYDVLRNWWKWFRFPAPPKDFLPEDGLGGVIIQKDNIDICAGFLYLSNSKVAWIEFIVSNPEYKEKDRKEAIKKLITELSLIAYEEGRKYIYTSVKNPSLLNILAEIGFTKGTEQATEMVMVLN